MHAADRLVAADAVPEARDHLVEDQQRARRVAQRAQALRGSPGAGSRPGELCATGSTMIAAISLARARSSAARDVVEVVEAADERRVDRGLEHPRRVRVAPPDALGAAQDVAEHVVVEAVVAALELDDLLAAGDAAGEPDRVVASPPSRCCRRRPARPTARARRSCARARPRPRSRRRRTARSRAIAARDARGHGRVRVAEEDRAVRRVVVDVAAAVEVPQVRARAAREAEPRLAAPAAGVHAAGDHLGGRRRAAAPDAFIA